MLKRIRRTSRSLPGKDRRLILSCNLLPWYNEINDCLETHSPTFPKAVLKKIEQFGPYEIEWISEKQTRLIKKITG